MQLPMHASLSYAMHGPSISPGWVAGSEAEGDRIRNLGLLLSRTPRARTLLYLFSTP